MPDANLPALLDLNDAPAIWAECERLRREKNVSHAQIGAAVGVHPNSYRTSANLCLTAGRGSVRNALRYLEVMRALPTNVALPTSAGPRKPAKDILAPEQPWQHLQRCLTLDESRAEFLRSQLDQVERRIEQTRNALACFGREGEATP